MTSATLAQPRALAAGDSAGGRWAELMWVGGITLVLYPLSYFFREVAGLDVAELAVGFTMFHLAHVINDPHFAVTYVLFYKRWKARALHGEFVGWQRARYWASSVVVPGALALWIVTAMSAQSATSLGLMIQLMFLLVGWHYVKQGFGVMIVLSARRGIRFSSRERLVILAHCYAGWAFAWANPHDPGRLVGEKGVLYTSLSHPVWLEPVAMVALIASSLALVHALVRKIRREGRLPLLTPLVALLCSVWAWLIFSSIDPLVRYIVPALHGVQYLYFVHLMKGNEAKEREKEPYFETSYRTRMLGLAITAVVLGFVLFRGLPPLLDTWLVPEGGWADADLGATPYFAAIYAFVNIHHYFMDSVIWRRENPETRYLVYSPQSSGSSGQ